MQALRALVLLMPLALTASLDASAAAEKQAPSSTEIAPDAPAAEDEGFMSYVYMVNDWYPIVLDPHLEPEVEEKVIWLWVMTVLFGAMLGPCWIPLVVVGEDPGAEYYMKEALIALVVTFITYAIGGATTTVGGLGSILLTVNLFYLAPVSLINTYDRALKRQRAKGPVVEEGEEGAPTEDAPPAVGVSVAPVRRRPLVASAAPSMAY